MRIPAGLHAVPDETTGEASRVKISAGRGVCGRAGIDLTYNLPGCLSTSPPLLTRFSQAHFHELPQ